MIPDGENFDEDDEDLKKNKAKKEKSISYFKLFQFATAWDKFLLFIGFIFVIIKSMMMPLGLLIYSEMAALLVERTYQIGKSSETTFLALFGGGKVLTNATDAENRSEIYYDAKAYGIFLLLCSIILFITGIICVNIFNTVALRQVTRMRQEFFKAVIRQNIAWHDIIQDQNFASRITDDIEKIRDGISEKLCHYIFLLVSFLTSGIFSFVYGWKLSLACSIYIPIIFFTSWIVGKYQTLLTTKEMNAFANSGSVFEEVVSGIRTVIAFNGEDREADRYKRLLKPAEKAGKCKGAFSGFGDGVTRSLLFLSSAGAFWYGIHLVVEDRNKEVKEYTPAVLMIAFFGILTGADNLSKTSPFLEAFALAKGSAKMIFDTIATASQIDPLSSDGKLLNYGLKGEIELRDVFFKYPSREDLTVLRGINLKIQPGETVALVGNSGCGKSTCLQLIQRFYDPIFGEILLDGLNIKKYNISWLRSNIAVVGQEPVLFNTSIGENIRFGKPDATQKDIEEASKAAGAHDFITNLADSYNTNVGEKGAQLSGGQKQRIAIARAMVQNPKILLLDEATSALDYHSEQLVQDALDKVRKGRTTLVVSHRLSAIKVADRIIYIENGKTCEEGTHDELMNLSGKYYHMVTGGGLANLDDDIDQEEENSAFDKFEKPYDDVIEKNLLYNEGRRKSSHHNHVYFRKGSEKLDFDFPPVKKGPALAPEVMKIEYGETLRKIVAMAKSEWLYLIMGFICATLYGCVYPAFAVFFGEFFAAMAATDTNEVYGMTETICIAMLVIGIATGVLCFLQTYFFNLAGVLFVTKLRSSVFKSIMRQEVAWFDKDENSVGALSARIAGDSGNVQGVIGHSLSGIIQATTNLALGIAIGFYFSWKLSLLCIVTVPLLAGSIVFETRFSTKSIQEEKEILEDASRIATEAIVNVRTIASLRQERHVIERYNTEIKKVEEKIRKKLKFRGAINSFGMSMPYFAYTFAMTYGSILVSEKSIEFHNVLKVTEALLFGSMNIGQALAFTPAFTTAFIAGQRLLQLLERKPHIKSPANISREKDKSSSHTVKYTNVAFRYPNRPNIPVLQGLNLEILQGKTVALVGHSGCGKSTCLQLLQRLYDPDDGKILMGSSDISRDMSLSELRGQLGLVSQEPVLFERSIAENIAYGDTTRDVIMPEILEAAKVANIHSFIVSLPMGYDTKLGSRGTQLSGGEKQRIAIARALIRNPKILLLDEATSALDLNSEKAVQSALDSACSGRTCLVIAHRLSTIQNADLICVIQNGRVVEQGNHQLLLAKNGIYARLHKIQPSL